ncbi:hypothetical protein LHYA1_G007647 [Lachnellula hyalina]|uniref:Uncharacterized protein n=1 Tax=Lachnellula hyalina TaxID=1316788 RepID=A0A8H8TUP7_9HELO|nr:uncharacterized protein LHYA1_G007647 [Lachnellula hyalina]TVY23034.1 hypothetical protein LHYA1_G007647 [Lachnellula hyalina]
MASSRTPLLANDHPDSDDEETTLLGGFVSTSPTRPFSTAFNPTLTTRSLALLLAIPAFIIFAVHGPHYAAPIVFLSFAIARQVAVLGSYFGSGIVVVRFEVVHPSVSEWAEEIKKGVAGIIDGVILLGLLISLSVTAHWVDTEYLPATVMHAGWIADSTCLLWMDSGFLLLSVPDFGNPSLLALAIAVEKPQGGVVRLATNLVFGAPVEEDHDDDGEDIHHRRNRRSHPRRPASPPEDNA